MTREFAKAYSLRCQEERRVRYARLALASKTPVVPESSAAALTAHAIDAQVQTILWNAQLSQPPSPDITAGATQARWDALPETSRQILLNFEAMSGHHFSPNANKFSGVPK